MSTQHKEALAHLLYGVNSGGFVMLTGEVGTGKTTIIRCLLEQLPKNADLAIVLNPSANARDLISSICDEFRITYDPSEKSTKVLTDALLEFLIENHKRGRRSIVLIDEAQLLRVSTLEQVRLLTNLETNTQKLLQIILVGQPELNALLAKPDLRQLSQRITARYHLRPLSEQETEAYIKHRLTIAGMPPGRNPFNPRIYRRIYQITHGIPRVINVLCDRLLLGAYSRDTTEVNAEICRQAAIEVLGEMPSGKQRAPLNPWLFVAGSGALVVVLLAILAFMWLRPTSPRTEPNSQPVYEQTTTPAPRPEPKNQSSNNAYWLMDEDKALLQVASAADIPFVGATNVCRSLPPAGWQCEQGKFSTWTELRDINRAGALHIITPGRERAYVALVGITPTQAYVQTASGVDKVPLAELGRLWSGNFTYIWQKPNLFSETVGRGTKSAFVRWVAQQFADLDGQTAPLAQDFFNQALQKRVKLFQREHGLEDDGFVGMQTLLKLNEVRGIETPLSVLTKNVLASAGGQE